jgi:thiamine monophosphate synthase
VVAIGGIDLANAGEVSRAGACAAAVISAIAEAENPTEATRALAAKLL